MEVQDGGIKYTVHTTKPQPAWLCSSCPPWATKAFVGHHVGEIKGLSSTNALATLPVQT